MAAKMDNQIDEEVKQRRADHIMELQACLLYTSGTGCFGAGALAAAPDDL